MNVQPPPPPPPISVLATALPTTVACKWCFTDHNSFHFLNFSAPTAPPKNVIFKSVTPTSIQITWSPPDPEKQNGVIAMYEVEVYQEMSGMIVEIITRSLMHANTTVWKISNLSPRTDYIFHVRAGTAGGYGPAVIVHKRSEGNPLAIMADFSRDFGP